MHMDGCASVLGVRARAFERAVRTEQKFLTLRISGLEMRNGELTTSAGISNRLRVPFEYAGRKRDGAGP